MAQISGQLLPISVQLSGQMPKEGAMSIPISYDFGVNGASVTIDMSQTIGQQQRMSMIQSIFFDNSANNQPAVLTVQGTQQIISLQAGWQAIMPILTTSSPRFTLTSQGTGICNIQFQNFPQPASQWAADPINSSLVVIPVSDAILDACVVSGRLNVRNIEAGATLVDRSGTITLGGTAQQLMAANASRRGWALMNVDEAILEGLYYSTTGTAAIATDGTWTLAPAVGSGYPGGYAQGVGTGAISIIAATTGHKFTAIEW